jgi:hypothetical protein
VVVDARLREWSVADYVSLREFARRQGVTLGAVQKAIASGRVTAVRRDEAGRLTGVEPELAAEQWGRNTDPVEALRNGKQWMTGSVGAIAAASLPAETCASSSAGEAAAGPVERSLAAAPEQPPAGGDGANQAPAVGTEDSYGEHRARRERFQAAQAELDYLERLGILVAAAEVDKEVTDLFVQVKAGVMRLAPKLAPTLAAETDVGRIERLLAEGLTRAFDEQSRRLADDATGGPEERAAALP